MRVLLTLTVLFKLSTLRENKYIEQLEKKYSVSQHEIQTEDGYILAMYEISKYAPDVNHTYTDVALMQHGLLDSSDAFMVLEDPHNWTENYLEKGYTVFLNNSRGNYYSNQHAWLHPVSQGTILKPDPLYKQYWDFTFHEMAKQDLVTFIKKVKDITNLSKFKYIGHSQGTMIMFEALSSEPKVQQSISHFVALAPIANLANQQSLLLKIMSTAINPIWTAAKTAHFYDFKVDEENIIAYSFCKLFSKVCNELIHWVSDIDPTTEPNDYEYFKHFPAGTSTKNMVNFAQLITSGLNLPEFDYGKDGNIDHYHQSIPPTYDLSLIPKEVKIMLCAGKGDLLADPKDVAVLEQTLKDTGKDFVRKDYPWGHLGFFLDENVQEVIDDSFEFLKD